MASFVFASAARDMAIGAVDLDTDTFYKMLVSSAPNKTAHTKRSDVTGIEVGNSGTYAAGGSACALTPVLAASTLTVSTASNNWTSATISAVGEVIYKRRGGAATADELVAFLDYGGTITSTASTFTSAASSFTASV